MDDVLQYCTDSDDDAAADCEPDFDPDELSWMVVMTNLVTWKGMNLLMTSMKTTPTPCMILQQQVVQAPPALLVTKIRHGAPPSHAYPSILSPSQ